MDLLSKRQELNANLIHIENSIYNLETVYIEDTNYGNVVRGYEGFLNSRAGHRKRSIESERIFSQSSVNVRRVSYIVYL
ncbi:histone acetyltransferase subunit NuA4-domain-containing protein [Globomyces pollinis-pini]|nr:histone acetyltransferase subunit NuA4-domain-containing protein [Globomyces pollinis-pini]